MTVTRRPTLPPGAPELPPFSLHVHVREQSAVGAARRLLVNEARRRGEGETQAGRLALIVTELGHNLLHHAGGGELLAAPTPGGDVLDWDVLSLDRGPGIASPERAVRDGFSTSGSSGNGLGGVQRLSDDFDLYSDGRGTVCFARVRAGGQRQPAHEHYDVGAAARPFPGEARSGDLLLLEQAGEALSAALLDVLGHGPQAADLAETVWAEGEAGRLPDEPLARLEALHRLLGGTRGAGATALRLGLLPGSPVRASGTLGGIGNVSAVCRQQDEHTSYRTVPGTLGYRWAAPELHPVTLLPGGLLVLHSDGLAGGATFAPERYPGLAQRRSSVVAGVLLRDFGLAQDDATVAVIKVRP